LPFIGILTQPEKVFASPWLSGLVRALGITSGAELVLPLTVGFALAALIAGGLRLLLLWVSIRLGNATGADLSIEVYRRTLYQSYSVHIARSSSEIISGITQKVGTATGVLISVVAVITSTSLFVAIMMTLVAIDPMVAIVAVMSFGSAYGLIAWHTRRRLVDNSHCIAHEQTQVVKALQEGLGAIRDVLLDGTQKVYCSIYQKAILQLQRAGGENAFINQAPRYAMEALGMALIAIFVLALSHREGGDSGGCEGGGGTTSEKAIKRNPLGCPCRRHPCRQNIRHIHDHKLIVCGIGSCSNTTEGRNFRVCHNCKSVSRLSVRKLF
jgi:ATP-binding cassette subfamily B protein